MHIFSARWRFGGKINWRFSKNAPDFLLVVHYNYGCIPLSYEVIQHYRTFRLGLDFPTRAVSWDFFDPWKLIATLRTLNRHTLTSNYVFLAIIRPHPLQIAVCRWVDETRRIRRRKVKKNSRICNCIFHPHVGSRSRKTDCYKMYQFSSFDQRTH